MLLATIGRWPAKIECCAPGSAPRARSRRCTRALAAAPRSAGNGTIIANIRDKPPHQIIREKRLKLPSQERHRKRKNSRAIRPSQAKKIPCDFAGIFHPEIGTSSVFGVKSAFSRPKAFRQKIAIFRNRKASATTPNFAEKRATLLGPGGAVERANIATRTLKLEQFPVGAVPGCDSRYPEASIFSNIDCRKVDPRANGRLPLKPLSLGAFDCAADQRRARMAK